MFKKSAPVLLLGGVMLAVSCASMAQDKGKSASKGGTSVVPTVSGGGKVSIDSLIQRYEPLAGSQQNVTSLVNGLHTGSEIILELKVAGVGMCTVMVPNCPANPANPISVRQCKMQPSAQHSEQRPCPDKIVRETFTPPTGSMGLGNVDIALALTEAQFTHREFPIPNITVLNSVLMNADSGILQYRARGMGWGQISNTLGFELK